MPTPNEGHPYRTPCSKCLEKDVETKKQKEDLLKTIGGWRDAYNELVHHF